MNLKKLLIIILIIIIPLQFNNLTVKAEHVAGINPLELVNYVGYTKDDTEITFFPNKNGTHFNISIGSKLVVLKDKKINGYVKILYDNKIYWTQESNITLKKPISYKYNVYDSGRKNYMDWNCITDRTSDQYKLQNSIAYTDLETGIRKIGDRYCIAVGSFFTIKQGTKINLFMDNGNIIKCILSDSKADCDTDSTHIYASDGSISEFIVNTSSLPYSAKLRGDVSFSSKKLKGKIIKVEVFE